MTVARWEQPALTPGSGRDVVDGWVGQLTNTVELAGIIAPTAFVPEALRDNPAATAACILAGREIGVPPLMALRHINVIKGRPAPTSELMRALVLRAGFTYRIEESTGTRCTITGKRPGLEHTVTWTTDMARVAGLLPARAGSGWLTYPRAMLLSRATAELCRAIFPDVIGGLSYSQDEVADMGDAPTVPALEAPPATRTVRRTRTPAAGPASTPAPPQAETPGRVAVQAPPPPAPELPPLPESPLPVVEEPPSGPPAPDGGAPPHDPDELLSPAQRAHLMGLFTQLGRMEPRALRLRTASGLVGRELTSMAQLTRAEASTLIDTLTHVTTFPDPEQALDALVTSGHYPPELPIGDPE